MSELREQEEGREREYAVYCPVASVTKLIELLILLAIINCSAAIGEGVQTLMSLCKILTF